MYVTTCTTAISTLAFYLSYRSVCITIYFTFLTVFEVQRPLRPGALIYSEGVLDGKICKEMSLIIISYDLSQNEQLN